MPETSPNDRAAGGAGQGPLEERLKAAREARGLSLTDVQQETRIPADVLQRLEDGRLLGDATFNPVYLKALLKAYAGAVGLNADQVLSEFDPGTHRLPAPPPHAVAVGTSPPPPPDVVAEATPTKAAPAQRPAAATNEDAPERTAAKPAAEKPPAAPTETPAADAKAVESKPRDAQAAREPADGGRTRQPAASAPSVTAAPGEPVVAASTAPAPKADPPAVAALGATAAAAVAGRPAPEKHRVMSAEQARTPRAFDRSWGLIIGGTIGIAAIFGGMLYLLFRDRTPAPEPRPRPVAVDTAAAPDTAAVARQEAPPPTQGPTLATPIRVTVTAGADGLQNFRVTAEPDQRLGHWIEAGQSMTFESPTAVILWGEGAEGLGGEATVELQGIRWAPADGRVLRIDVQTGQRLLDSLSADG